MSLIKTPQDIKELRVGGKILANVLREAEKAVKVGLSLMELDTLIERLIDEAGAKPSFLNYDGFPAASCLSLNSQVVHGIPDGRVLKQGDILGIDVGLWYNNLCVDAAITVGVGEITKEAKDLLAHTQEALNLAIKSIKPFYRIGMISQTIQNCAEKYNHGIVRGLTGHGVGHHVHEDPSIPNFGRATDGILMKPGQVLAIEPMLTNGGGEVGTEIDGWGIVTLDDSLAAQFEHTVLVTQRGAEILTK